MPIIKELRIRFSNGFAVAEGDGIVTDKGRQRAGHDKAMVIIAMGAASRESAGAVYIQRIAVDVSTAAERGNHLRHSCQAIGFLDAQTRAIVEAALSFDAAS